MDVLMHSNQVKHAEGERVAANPGMMDDGFHVIIKLYFKELKCKDPLQAGLFRALQLFYCDTCCAG